jgi:hypothetical protein
VVVCGNYGRRSDQIDGQAIKTRTIRDALAAALGNGVVTALDTSSILRRPFSFYAEAKERFTQSRHALMLPGRRGLRVLLPLFLRWKRQQGTDIRYVVIGGWLPSLLAENRRVREACRQLDGIYVEMPQMATSMEALGFTNVHLLPNFRSFDRDMPRSYRPATSPVKLVFCARVIKEKGIEDAISAVDQLARDPATLGPTLDVYGPVPDSYKRRFHHLVHTSPNTTYKGVLPTEQVYAVLQQYDLMLFPTYYSGEGFPGTIIDAFVAGVPVLASNWKYNSELIDTGRTGAICSPRSVSALVETLRKYTVNPVLLSDMRQHCISRAQEYHSDRALNELLLHLAIRPVSPDGLRDVPSSCESGDFSDHRASCAPPSRTPSEIR